MYTNSDQPSLALLYDNGMLQLMRNIHDDNVSLVDTELKPTDSQWNHDGTILAIVGHTKSATSTGSSQNAIHFFTPFGELIRWMKLPGNQVTGLAWEAFSSRIALAIDYYIYLAQVRHNYMWTSFSNTLVYHFTKRNKPESYVMFWDTKNNEVHYRFWIVRKKEWRNSINSKKIFQNGRINQIYLSNFKQEKSITKLYRLLNWFILIWIKFNSWKPINSRFLNHDNFDDLFFSVTSNKWGSSSEWHHREIIAS